MPKTLVGHCSITLTGGSGNMAKGVREHLPPAWHVGLSDCEASKQIEEGVEVCWADSSQLDIGCQCHCHHSCITWISWNSGAYYKTTEHPATPVSHASAYSKHAERMWTKSDKLNSQGQTIRKTPCKRAFLQSCVSCICPQQIYQVNHALVWGA